RPLHHYSLCFVKSLSRTLNSQLPQFFLQTLSMQAHHRRRFGNVPAMLLEFSFEINNLKLPPGFAKITFSQEGVFAFAAITPTLAGGSGGQGPTLADLFRQIARGDFIAAAQNQAALNRVAQLAHITRPIVGDEQVECRAAEPRLPVMPRPKLP